MKPESIVVGIAGALFGLLCGWMLGAQQVAPVAAPAAQVASAPAAAQGQQAPSSTATPVDIRRAQELEAQASQDPKAAEPRTQLGNMYFDAERYLDAAKWYEASLQVAPANPDVSTDLAVSYYYSNQVDKALAQFARSLEIDSKHTKTWLNLGIVRAFGKQDLTGAAEAWNQVVALAPPDAPEARAARQALDGLKAAHPETGAASPSTAPAGGATGPKQGA